MGDPQLVIRVAANLAAMRANLQDGISQLETWKGAMRSASDAFDGARIVGQAAAAAKAIENAGGVTALTAAQQKHANDIFTEAAEKLDLMGKGGSQQARIYKELAAQTTQVRHEHLELLEPLKDVAKALGLVWSIDRGVAFVSHVLEEAHALHVLSLQTQIGVEDLQILAAATKEYGVDSEQLGRAVYQLSRRIAGGDDSVAVAYHLMGKSLEDVKNLGPMQLFLETERGLGTLKGAIRDTAASDLYGGRLGVSLGAFSTGVDEAMEKAQRFNHIASKESVEALAEYQVAIDKAKKSLEGMATDAMGKVAQGFNVLVGAHEKGASTGQIFVAMLKDAASTFNFHGGNATALATLLDHLNQQTDKNTASTAKQAAGHQEAAVAVSEQTKALQFMLSLEKDSAKPILEWQRFYLENLDQINQLTAKNAAAIGVNADQFARYKKGAEIAKESALLLAKVTAEYQEKEDNFYATDVDRAANAANRKYEIAVAEAKKRGVTDQAYFDKLDALRRLDIQHAHAYYDDLRTNSVENSEAIAAKWAATQAAMEQSGLHFTEQYKRHVEFMKDAAAAATQGITLDENKYYDYSKAKLDQKAADERALYMEMVTHASDFSIAAIHHQRKVAEDARDAARNWRDAWEDGFDKTKDKAVSTAEAIKVAFEKAASDEAKFINDQVDAAVRALSGQAEYDLSTQQGMDFFKRYNPNASVNASAEYFKTHTLEDAIREGLVNLGFRGRLQGFAGGVENFSGGLALVGERGPELVNLPRGSDVIPNGLLGVTTIHIHVSGIWDSRSQSELTNAVAAGLVRLGRVNRQFSLS